MNTEKLEILERYCRNDMQLLKRLSRAIFNKFSEPLAYSDYDDFYSIANLTLWQCCTSFEPSMGVSFEGFLISCLQKKFKTELTRRNRQKRVMDRFNISLDSVNSDDEEYSLLNILASDFDTFDEVMKIQKDGQFENKVQTYISRLSNRQKQILDLIIKGYKPNEIRTILNIKQKEYVDNIEVMKAYENIKYLI